jgi:hypothetical protein
MQGVKVELKLTAEFGALATLCVEMPLTNVHRKFKQELFEGESKTSELG